MVVDAYQNQYRTDVSWIPLKQVNRNGIVYVNGASAFKPATMTQGGAYFGSAKAYLSSISAQKPIRDTYLRQVAYKQSQGGTSSHDGSSVAARRRRIAVGKNATRFGLSDGQPSQFKSNGRSERNSVLARARSGGSIAPKKKGARRP